ncbi:Type 1 glutamine amidotransferase-like domain-containing protein [Citricoccus sp. GCM10030269]|uniref:Type 1 glutamine amidotransferase-like domain-containing protein n=1 Tax=Citricoccus sp. GCM10030269 TaxID=3273388 RepID=UPI003618F9C2
MKGTMVALGGGGFSMSEDGASALDDYILAMTKRPRPRICFIPTASGDADTYSERFEAAFRDRADTSVLSLFCHEPWGYSDPAMLLEQDVIYVGGGSTANLLAIWRLHGLPEMLEKALDSGTVLAGISAGMNCWFESSSTDSYGPLAPLDDGLGLIPGSACPHYLSEPRRRESYQHWVATGALADGFAVDDYAAVVWRDGAFVEAVAEQRDRPVFWVERTADGVVEREIPVRLLGQ